MSKTFRDIGEEELFFQHTQLTKYTHIYSITLQMPMPQVAGQATLLEPVLQIMEDADFHVTHLTGSVTSPTDVNGQRVVNAASGLSLGFPAAGAANRSDRGISFKFVEPATNRALTRGNITRNAVDLAAQTFAWDHSYVPFEDVFTPGYGNDFGKPVPFKFYLPRSARLKVMLQCIDSKVSTLLYQRVSMAFIGNRYAT